jgi:hypothetical protein
MIALQRTNAHALLAAGACPAMRCKCTGAVRSCPALNASALTACKRLTNMFCLKLGYKNSESSGGDAAAAVQHQLDTWRLVSL